MEKYVIKLAGFIQSQKYLRMVLWWIDRDKWQREKDLLNWERTAEEGEQGGSSSIKGCDLLSQLSKGAGEHPCWWKVIETAK